MSEYEKYDGEIDIKTTGKNLFHTIEIGGIKYTDNIPDGMNIGITKEQYIEYLQLQQENKQLKRDKNIMQNYLEFIINIGCDYDGYNDVENLKALIDELCKYALCGIKLDDKKIISSSCKKYYNILGEEILGEKE